MRQRIYRYLHGVTAPDRTGLVWFDLVEIGLVALGFLAYFLVRGSVVDRTGDALANARWIIEMQSSIGIFIEPEINRWALESEVLVRLFNFVYFWLDFPLVISVGLLLFWRSRNHYTLLRDSLLISGGLALVLYWSFPVAPPRFLPEWGFVDTLEQFSDLAYQAQVDEAVRESIRRRAVAACGLGAAAGDRRLPRDQELAAAAGVSGVRRAADCRRRGDSEPLPLRRRDWRGGLAGGLRPGALDAERRIPLRTALLWRPRRPGARARGGGGVTNTAEHRRAPRPGFVTPRPTPVRASSGRSVSRRGA